MKYLATESLVSCTGDSANSTTPAIAGTITRSVYPTPATNASVSSGPVSGSSPPSNTSLTYHSPPTGWQSQSLCPCGNSTTIIMTTVTASTTNNDSTPIASTQITYSASTSYHPATYTGGPFPSSAGRTVRVPSLLSLVARFLSLSDVAMAAIGNPGMANRATAAVELEGRFYPYPSPLNSGRPPKATPEKRFYPYPSPLNSGLPPHLTAKPRVVRDLRPTMDILSADESPTPILSLRPPPGAPTSGTLVVTSPFPSSSGGLTAETSEISSSFIHTPDTFTPSCSVVLNVTITESVPIPTTVSIILNQPRSSKSMEDAITVYTTLPSSFNVTETLATTTISTYTTDAITTETLSTPPFSGPVMASSTTVTANAATQASLDVLGMLTIVLMWFGQA
ncbi:hypothetical protein H2198_000400 [Neophaeococcomyces mojaviensis]|uniref:Uncharacterized protein n=1 Tax=Neophaeococcomyces mojaviensis TaxID=3383035 RepID=A0ACC3AKH7_9EURO|nr:hypothetical protein H2198_000400 [Knufia sp. JES_112]